MKNTLKALFVTLTLTFAFPPPSIAQTVSALQETAQDFTGVAEHAIPAVVSIQVKSKSKKKESGFYEYDPSEEFFHDEFFGRFFGIPRRDKAPNPTQISQGSGFIISSDGYILTNSHVVRDQVNLMVKLNDGREFPAQVIGEDDSTDVALIKVEATDLPYLTMGNSDNLKVGQWVVAIGNTLGLQATLTVGVVSAKGRSNLDIARVEDFIQTDAAINRGNSGGPLLNIKGEVVGINTAIASNFASGYMGIGFAIPSNMASNSLDQLKATGSVIRGFLGVLLQEINSDLAQSFGLNRVEGALIAEVQKDSPAEKAGLKQGDIVLMVNNQKIDRIGTLRNMVALQNPGSRLTLTILRDKRQIEIPVQIGTFQKAEELNEENGIQNPFGFEVKPITPELNKSLNLSDAQGVIVSKVIPGSPADMIGLKKGAIIVAVNQQQVNSPQEFYLHIKQTPKGQPTLFLIKQGDKMQYVSMRVD